MQKARSYVKIPSSNLMNGSNDMISWVKAMENTDEVYPSVKGRNSFNRY
jgi:hypothetical protein